MVKRQILGAIRARRITDEKLSPIWALAPALVGVIGGLIGFVIIYIQLFDWVSNFGTGVFTNPLGVISTGYAVFAVSVSFAFMLIAILVHELVRRQNEHFEREAQLRIGVMSFLRVSAGTTEREAAISIELATMNLLHNQAIFEERAHSAIGWAVVIMVGGLVFATTIALGIVGMIVGLYLFSILMNGIAAHDNRWSMFSQQMGSAFQKLGYTTNQSHWTGMRLQRRSFGLYVALTVITLGLFTFYWLYILIKDPNEHFAWQEYFEDNLAVMIK